MATSTSDLRDLLFRSNPIPMFLFEADSLRICSANDAALEKYGYSYSEFRSMTVRDLCPRSQMSPSDLHLDAETPAVALCCTHATKAGSPFVAELRVVRFHRGHRKLLLMFAVDATAWSEARLKLVRSEGVHRSLVDECPFGIYRLDLTTSRFEHANPALLNAIGYTLEELSSVGIPSLYVEARDRNRFFAELLSAGKVRDFETRFRKKDGGIVRVSLSGYLCTNAETGRQYIQGYALDITRQRELEEELSHSYRMEAVGRLAGGVAHDFNNITQSISLSCELALSNQLPPAIESKLLDVMQQTARAAEITRQLLAFSRRQVLRPRVVNINDCVRSGLPMLTRVVGVGVAIELQLDETVDHIFIDPEQLALVLMHLADNARNAMPQGGRLRIETAAPFLASTADGSQPCAILTISDTGVGMNEITLGHIFEPFFSTKNTTVASGLGLSSVHGIVAQSKGRIECQSSPGKGTTFRIYLPIAADQPVSRTTGNSGFRILLAEDDPVVNKHLTHSLRRAGFSVDSVCNGEEALTAFGRHSYHVVVSDILMPRLGGLELTRRLRQLVPSLPVVLISGSNPEESVIQQLPNDRIVYLQKPFSSSQLVATVHGLLSGITVERK